MPDALLETIAALQQALPSASDAARLYLTRLERHAPPPPSGWAGSPKRYLDHA